LAQIVEKVSNSIWPNCGYSEPLENLNSSFDDILNRWDLPHHRPYAQNMSSKQLESTNRKELWATSILPQFLPVGEVQVLITTVNNKSAIFGIEGIVPGLIDCVAQRFDIAVGPAGRLGSMRRKNKKKNR